MAHALLMAKSTRTGAGIHTAHHNQPKRGDIMFKAIRAQLKYFCDDCLVAMVFAQANDHQGALAYLVK